MSGILYSVLLSAVLATGSFLLTGCESSPEGVLHTVSSKISHWYDAYIDPPAKVNYANVEEVADYQMVLSQRMATSETRISQLERYLMTHDKWPETEELPGIMQQFPWISGVVDVSSDGEVLEKEPSFELKELDYSKILEGYSKEDNLYRRTVVGTMQESPLGPELMLGIPIYHDMEYVGIFMLHFDVRALLLNDEEAKDLVITSPKGVLWPGRFIYDETPLSTVDWAKVLEGETSGIVKNQHGTFFWLVRYVGKEPLIFAIPTGGTFPEDASQSSQLLNGRESPPEDASQSSQLLNDRESPPEDASQSSQSLNGRESPAN